MSAPLDHQFSKWNIRGGHISPGRHEPAQYGIEPEAAVLPELPDPVSELQRKQQPHQKVRNHTGVEGPGRPRCAERQVRDNDGVREHEHRPDEGHLPAVQTGFLREVGDGHQREGFNHGRWAEPAFQEEAPEHHADQGGHQQKDRFVVVQATDHKQTHHTRAGEQEPFQAGRVDVPGAVKEAQAKHPADENVNHPGIEAVILQPRVNGEWI